jgi:putative ribosome biogenesis GTPase RsgA
MNDKNNNCDNVVLIGESGVGKSTILNYLAGVELKGVRRGTKI